MPELPEVEVVRLGLAEHLVGREISFVDVFDARSLKRHLGGPQDFVDRLLSRTVVQVNRRGKYLWLSLDDGSSVVVHLGMSGQFRIFDQASSHRHLRIAFTLDNGQQVTFLDQRIFGGMFLDESDPPEAIAHIAFDPLDVQFDDEAFVARLLKKNVAIKRCLLDQSLISGIGNIYADEALWRARLHYDRQASGVSATKARELLGHAREVMANALAQGGTSFDALYVNVNGESGYFSRSLQAYGREGEPCERCGTAIRREAFMNRSSHFCPRCQRQR